MTLAHSLRSPDLRPRERAEVRAADFSGILAASAGQVKVLSLDCFDTLLFRTTTAPVDVFFDLQKAPCFAGLGFNAKLRIGAEATARQLKKVRSGLSEVRLPDIYRAAFPALTDDQVAELSEAELTAEIRACYAFPETVDLIRRAKAGGLRVILVSDTYLDELQLRRLLQATLPGDAYACIDQIFCSCAHGRSKGDGLFKTVLEKLRLPPAAIVHLGDNVVADFHAPQAHGIPALHFVHHDSAVTQVLRLQGTAGSLLCPTLRDEASLPSPFRGVFAATPTADDPAFTLGYLAAGPVLYAFGRYVLGELSNLRAAGKRPKALFLLRDAHLPQQVCEAIAGEPVGHAVAISRFASIAASFRSVDDLDDYLARSAGSARFESMAKQMLFPEGEARELVAKAKRAKHSVDEFVRLVRRPSVLTSIVARSKAFRARLYKYLEVAVGLEAGDTLVFVDLGYEGTAQRRLEPVFREERQVEVIGRYLLTARTPGWEKARRGLMDPSWCDDRVVATVVPYIALLEDLCTSDHASVVDYTEDGAPVRAAHVLPAEQYERVRPVQAHCIAFARAAESFFARSGKQPDASSLRTAALASLARLLFLPTEPEIAYLEGFRLDMNLATTDAFRLFDRDEGLTALRRRGMFVEKNQKTPRINYPIELRAAGLELVLSLVAQHRYSLDFSPADTTLRREAVRVLVGRGDETTTATVEAQATHDGFYSLLVPVGNCEMNLGIMLWDAHRWVQLESVHLIEQSSLFQDSESEHTEDLSSCLQLENVVERGAGLFECTTEAGFVFVSPRTSGKLRPKGAYVCRIIYRPIESRTAPGEALS